MGQTYQFAKVVGSQVEVISLHKEARAVKLYMYEGTKLLEIVYLDIGYVLPLCTGV